MKITKKYLRKLIKEEVEKVFEEFNSRTSDEMGMRMGSSPESRREPTVKVAGQRKRSVTDQGHYLKAKAWKSKQIAADKAKAARQDPTYGNLDAPARQEDIKAIWEFLKKVYGDEAAPAGESLYSEPKKGY